MLAVDSLRLISTDLFQSLLIIHFAEGVRSHAPPIQRLAFRKPKDIESEGVVVVVSLYLAIGNTKEVPLTVSLCVGVHSDIQIVLVLSCLDPLYSHTIP